MRRIISWSVTLLVLCCSLTVDVYAQTKTIKGIVRSDEGSIMPGVTISVSGSSTATITDDEGAFSIQAASGQTLEFSFVGYQTETTVVGNANAVSIVLKKGDSDLDEVVVVGFGTQKKENLTGAVTTVNVGKTIGSRPIADLGRGLQGAVPGLTITAPSGDIGNNPSFRLRGLTGSLTNVEGAKPLILVDNVEFPDLRLINPDDVEGISVLKDAASTAIYGPRATWGVILITTKKGKKGNRYNISYSNNFSWGQPTVVPEIAPAVEGAEMAFLALRRTNPSLPSYGAVGQNFDSLGIVKMKQFRDQYGDGSSLGQEMVIGRDFEVRSGRLYFYRPWDVRELYLKDWTPQQTHNLTLSGSTDKTTYNFNLGLFDQKGVLKVKEDRFKRYNANLGLTSQLAKWFTARAKFMLSNAQIERPYNFNSDAYDAWYYLYRWQRTYPYGLYEGKPWRGAIAEVEQAKMNQIKTLFARVSAGGTFTFAPGLTLDVDYTYDANNEHEQRVGGGVKGYNFWAGGGAFPYETYTTTTHNRAQLFSNWSNRKVFKGYATYIKSVTDHNFKLMLGGDYEDYNYTMQSSERRQLLDANLGLPNVATGEQFVGSSKNSWATAGYVGRFNYDYKGKYLLELNGRYDGSSKFPTNEKWGFFKSISGGYVLSNESFMESLKTTLSFVKFRASWGELGNQAIPDFTYISTMPIVNSGWIAGKEQQATVGQAGTTNALGYQTPRLVSDQLTWEKSAMIDFGVDLRFLNNKLSATFDWYRRTITDMHTGGITTPVTLGVLPPTRNYGAMQTTGWELELGYNDAFENGLGISVLASLSDFKEKITKFANSTKGLGPNEYYTGKTLGDIWGYETDRFFTEDDFKKDAAGNLVKEDGKYVLNDGIPTQKYWEATWFYYGPGDVKYKDLNGDGKIDFGANTLDNRGDLKVIGNSTPRYQYGFRLGLTYKGFDFNTFIQGIGKRDAWPNGPVFIPGYRPGEAWYAHQTDYWTPENPNAFYPRPTDYGGSAPNRNFLVQTKYMLNMAYTRLKNVNVGYTLPQKWISPAKLSSFRVYVSGENLFTISHTGKIPLDPEVDYTVSGLGDPNTFGRVYPFQKMISFGLQATF